MTDEKRRAERYAVWFPMQMVTDGDVIMVISRNLSELGVMMVAAAEPTIGAEVTMKITIPDDDAGEREVKGKIVRVDPNTSDQEGLWKHKVAVEFDERIEQLEPVLEVVSRASQPPVEP